MVPPKAYSVSLAHWIQVPSAAQSDFDGSYPLTYRADGEGFNGSGFRRMSVVFCQDGGPEYCFACVIISECGQCMEHIDMLVLPLSSCHVPTWTGVEVP